MNDASTLAAVVALLNIAVTIGGGFYFVGRVTARMDAHEINATRVEHDVQEVKTLLVSSAVEADRLRRAEADIQNVEYQVSKLDDDIRNLRKGVGWIKDAGSHAVDREY